MMRALITGGAGFLGTHLTRRLLSEGYAVTVLDDLSTGRRANLAGFEDKPNFTFLKQDVAQPFSGEFEEIYSLACPASPPHYQRDPVKTLWTSIFGLKNCLDLARATGAKVLQASTSEIYGDPLVHPQVEGYWGNVNTIGLRSCYDEGKRVAETMAADYRRQYGVDVRLVRIFNTYGPFMDPSDGRVVSNFITQALKNQPLTIFGTGEQTRSFQYCEDLIEAMRRFMVKTREEIDMFFAESGRPAAPVINAGNPGEFTMLELAQEVLRQIPESTSTLVFRDLPSDDPRKRKPDIALAKELLGWEPKVGLADGIAKTIEYFCEIFGIIKT